MGDAGGRGSSHLGRAPLIHFTPAPLCRSRHRLMHVAVIPLMMAWVVSVIGSSGEGDGRT